MTASSNLRVVIADDDPVVLDLVGLEFEEMGMEVSRTQNGVDLIDMIANRGPFDLIVTDIAMPWMNGLQVARCLRTAKLDTPLILITAHTRRDVLEEASHFGSSTVLLRKPFDLGDLGPIVCSLLPQLSQGEKTV